MGSSGRWSILRPCGYERAKSIISRILYPACRAAIIYLALMLPSGSSDPPGAQTKRAASRACVVLLPMGFAWPLLSPAAPVRSYRTVSPSPPAGRGQSASLLHSAVGSPRLAVSQHRALWSADFPRAGNPGPRSPDRLGSPQLYHTGRPIPDPAARKVGLAGVGGPPEWPQ